jgi:two-component system chemotaxis response regulator CheY
VNFYNKNAGIGIVIADDDATTRMVLRTLLTDNLYTVVGEAVDGEKAVELCALHKPQIAFLDIDMPKMNGNQAASKIRELLPQTGIVMVSAISTLDNVQQALQAGASSFVVKPFSPGKVVDAINTCLKKSHQQAGARR